MIFPKNKVFIIAEIGNNHEGNFNLAKKMINSVAKTGADAVKFQTFIPEKYVNSKNKKRLKQLKKFQLSIEQFKRLRDYAKKKKLLFFSTPFDVESAIKLNKFQSIFKISSGDNNFLELIETIAGFGKPIIISTGFADYKLLKYIYKKIINIWEKKKVKSQIIFMHCVSDYPVEDRFANLNAISTLRQNFKKCIIGYSDHTLGTHCAEYSVLLGAKVIEKHFTIDNNFSKFRDHKISANPKSFKKLTSKIRNISKILGNGEIQIEKCELKNIKKTRRSFYVNSNLKKNQVIRKDLINIVRPGLENSILDHKKIIGKKIKRNINFGQKVTLKNTY